MITIIWTFLIACCCCFCCCFCANQSPASKDLISSAHYQRAWSQLENYTRHSLSDLVDNYEKEFSYILVSRNVSDKCKESLIVWANGIRSMNVEDIKRLDSWGHLPSSMLDGSLISLGGFTQCMNSTANRYCLAFGKMPLMPARPIEGIPYDYPSQSFNFTSPVFNYLKPYIHYLRYVNITTGICMPRECTKDDINIMANLIATARSTGLIIDVDMCQTREPVNPIKFSQMIAGSFILTIVICNIFGIYASPGSFLSHFNFSANLAKLFKTRPRLPGQTIIPCLDGMKALTMLFMLHIHVCFSLLLQNMLSFFRSKQLVSNPVFSSNLFGPYTMETFFLLTGLETTIQLLSNHKKLPGHLFLFLRWTRFLPCIIWMICCYIIFFSDHFRDYVGGPFWNYYHAVGSIPSTCERTWFNHIFMVAHYFNTVDDLDLCLLADWYLEADYAFAILFVLFILPFIQRNRKFHAVLSTLTMILLGPVILGLIIHFFSVQTSWIPMAFPQEGLMKYCVYIHSKVWGHFSGYFCGVLLGFLMGAYQLKISKTTSIIMWSLWFIGWIIMLTYEAGLNYRLFPVPYTISLIYGMFSKTIWSYLVAWLIYSSHNGHVIEIIPKLLSSRVFTILSRVNLSALFVNPLVFRLRNATYHTNVNFELFDFTFSVAFPELAMIYFLSFLFCAMIEVPSVNIMKSLLIKDRRSVGSEIERIKATENRETREKLETPFITVKTGDLK